MTVAEGLGAKTPLASDLAAGVDAISSNQRITFTKYVRLVLPIDGSVFWVRATILSDGALINAAVLNSAALNELPIVSIPAASFSAKGSLHYATENRQNVDAAYAINRVVFTSEVQVDDLNAIGPTTMYIGEFQGQNFAFRERRSFYKQADLHHYVGDAVYPIMRTQIIDDAVQLANRGQVVSNSLPIWLSIADYFAPGFGGIGNFAIGESAIGVAEYFPWKVPFAPIPAMFPSYLAEENIVPPFATIHIPPESTQALASAPFLGPRLSHSQLARDKVKITFYGLRNADALGFVDTVNQFSLDRDLLGIMNIPTVRDEKQTQVELNVIAIKKTIEYEVSYYQSQARDVARQLILSAIPTFIFPT